MLRPLPGVLLPFALAAAAWELEAAFGLVLHTGLREPALLGAALAVIAADPGRFATRVGAWMLAGAALWAGLAWCRARAEGRSWRGAADAEAATFRPLWIVPATTALAILALVLRSTWPYALTLAVALTQDLSRARDVLVAAALLALRVPALRIPAPRAGGVFFVTFLAYALLTPEWARQWDNHPGNEPKYLRMAVALGHRLSLDVEPVSASLEELQPLPLSTAAASAAVGLLRESSEMLGALAQGQAVGRDAIRATRITRQTIGGKDGGVFHVLAPGPSLVLAPALRVDRALNRRFSTPGRLAVSMLLLNALGALLVTAVFQLARDATARPGLAATLAFAFGLLPPFLFYFFQVYPEMPGALVLAVLFRVFFLRDGLSVPAAWGAGLLLSTLPWLHQKFVPVWLVLTASAAAWLVLRERAPRSVLLGLLAPQALSLYLTALYNFGIAGSVRPDALFLAWGPAGVTTARVGQGLFGLWLDARYGLLPMAPVFALGLFGLFVRSEGGARLRAALPAALVYYLTVAAADNWAGAVCNLGRYLMPILPLVVAYTAVVLARTASRRGALALALGLFGLSFLCALALWRDPHAANDTAVLLEKSRFADGRVYIPGLFIRTWAAGAPGLFARLAVWLLLLAGLGAWLLRVARGRGGERPLRAIATAFGLVLLAAAILERWPMARRGPSFSPAILLSDGRTVFLEGPVRDPGERLYELGSGETTLLVRAPQGPEGGPASPGPPATLTVLAGGTGTVESRGRAPLLLRPEGLLLNLPLEAAATVRGASGARETLFRQVLRVAGPPMALRFPGAIPDSPEVSAEKVEPPPSEER